MLELAINYGKGNTLLKDIARRQNISEGYLEHLVPPLKAAGLVKSSRGSNGGYALTKHPSDINLKDIIEIMEGSLSLVECRDNSKECARSSYCIMQDAWKEISNTLSNQLQSKTLDTLADDQRERSKNHVFYNI